MFDITETGRWRRTRAVRAGEATDNIPWMMYKDGIRELRLLKDFERNESSRCSTSFSGRGGSRRKRTTS